MGWTTKDSERLYGIPNWGMGHFSVSKKGTMQVRPFCDDRSIDLAEVVKEAKSMGLKPPLTIRIQDLLHARVKRLNEAFQTAIDEEDYAGRYRGCSR